MLIENEFDRFKWDAWRPHDSYATCLECNGSGKNKKKRKQKCPVCKGSGYNHDRCGRCFKVIDLELSFNGNENIKKTLCECRFNDDGTFKAKRN